MKVSIIIPAYNAAATLAEAVASVISQTKPDWELIIVNDGSVDDTAALAAALAEGDSRIRVINQANQGESGARNRGIAEAQQEWLLFLDADDWIAPNYLERMLEALEAEPGVDAIHCGWARVAQDGTEITEDYRPPAGDLFPVLARRAAFPVHACVVRRSVVEGAGRFDVALVKSPDWDLWQRIARRGAKFGSVPDVMAYYRMAQHSASLDAERMLADGLTVLRRGHANDPRVSDPLPQYAGGWTGSTVESQEYYLLCWCAGLMLGSGGNPARLLSLVNSDRYEGLYANAVAQCIFDSAPLPSCRSRSYWEERWQSLIGPASEFFAALEAQTQTVGLASDASRELKKLVLKSSPVWGDVIQREEAAAASLQDTIAKFVEGTAWLTSDRDQWRKRSEESERRTAELTAEGERLAASLDRTRRELEAAASWQGDLAEQNQSYTARLQSAIAQSQELEQQHAESVQKLAAMSRRAAQLEQAIHSTGLELTSARGQIQTLQRQHVNAVMRLEQDVADRNLELAAGRARIREWEHKQTLMEQELAAAQGRIRELENELGHVLGELEKWRKSATDRALLIDELQADRWMRLGTKLGMTSVRECEPATDELATRPAARRVEEHAADPAMEARWELRVAEGNEANVIYPRQDHEMVKIEVAKAGTKVDWDIQLNRLGFAVAGGCRYAVVFRARSKRPREIGVGFAMAHEPWETLGMYNKVPLTHEWQVFEEEFTALKSDEDARIHFDLGGRAVGVDLTAVSLRALDGADPGAAVGASESGRAL